MSLPRSCAAAAAGVAALVASSPGFAQTWAGGRLTPDLAEIVAIDATGEASWLYGKEDLVGDGDAFKQQEQSIDIRTAYAATDATRFWARVYVSDPNAVGGNVTAYVFIDADENPATGGSAAAPEINAKFSADPTPGGYEYVIELRGNGSVPFIWAWDQGQAKFVSAVPPAAQATGETGQDTDPIQINGDAHGYLQSIVDLGLVGLTQACTANLFFRSTNAISMGTGDLEVGKVGACVPTDANDDGVPDLVIPIEACTSDAECPGDGICVSGMCIVPVECVTDADCPLGDECSPSGLCVPKPAGPCSTDADCGDLVCRDQICSPCNFGSDECGAGRVCAPTGRCVVGSSGTGGGGQGGGGQGGGGGGPSLNAGEEVRGGACACSAPGGGSSHLASLASLGLSLLYLGRRRSRVGQSRRATSVDR